MADRRLPPPAPSLTVTLGGGTLTIAGSGPSASLSLAVPGRPPVTVHPTEREMGDALDAIVARRHAMRRAQGVRP